MRILAVTFDYGGTLDGPASHWLDRFAALYAAAGVPCSFGDIKQAFYATDAALEGDRDIRDASLHTLLERHVELQLAHLDLPRNGKLRERLVSGFLQASEKALAASARVLAKLAPRYRLGVVSNFYGNLERILTDAGLRHCLRVIADSGRLGFRKPAPEIFHYALAALGVPPQAVAHVGDSYERDVRAARAVGCRSVWLAPGAEAEPPSDGPDARLPSLDAVAAWLDGQANQLG